MTGLSRDLQVAVRTLAACYLPARLAARLDPVVALRSEQCALRHVAAGDGGGPLACNDRRLS